MDQRTNKQPTWLELESARPLAEVEEITSLSRDNILKNYPHLCVRLSPKRWGMKLKYALAIANGTAQRSS